MVNLWHRLPIRAKRGLRAAAVVVAVGLILDLSAVIGFSITHPAIPEHVDAVVVLGAKVGTPALTYRTLTGLKYYEEGKTNTLILSGARGPGEPVSEAQAMQDVIQERIAKTHGNMPHIILETRSANTFQNLSNSRALAPHAQNVIVVSDGYHLARSVAIAKHVGFNHVYWDAPKPSYYKSIDLAHYYMREVVAIIAYLPKLI